MTVVVFVGPTIAQRDAERLIDAEFQPPALLGDIYRAALKRPNAIGIIDGYFESTPAIWHKEILWAMAAGVHVFGAASMGALRAAELYPFGMVGVGEIFEAYRDGDIEDDDEVAVVHGPAELGYPLLSEAMVNIRSTLRHARGEEIVSANLYKSITARAKALYYKDRQWEALLNAEYNDEAGLNRFRTWAREGIVNQKRLDAEAMLCEMAAFAKSRPDPKKVDYHFENTVFWTELERAAPSGAKHAMFLIGSRDSEGIEAPSQRVLSSAVLRLLVKEECARRGVEPTLEELRAAMKSLGESLGVDSVEQLENWKARYELTQDEVIAIVRDQVLESRLVSALTRESPEAVKFESKVNRALSVS